MAIAIAATLSTNASAMYDAKFQPVLFAAIGGGAVIGAIMAARVAMTAMPELVALLHSFVGLAAVLVGVSTFLDPGEALSGVELVVHDVEIFLDVGIGAITFTGSIVAWAKLSGRLGGKPLLLPATR